MFRITKINRKILFYFLSLTILLIGLASALTLVQEVQRVEKYAATPVQNYSISPATQTVQPGQNFNFSVHMNTATKSILGVNIYIQYNPAIILVTSIQKGSGVSNLETEIVNKIDNTIGELNYAAFTTNTTNAANGSDLEVIVVSGTVKSIASLGSSTNLSFKTGTLPGTEMTDITGTNVLVGTVPGKITVGSANTPTPPTSTPKLPVTLTPTPTGVLGQPDTVLSFPAAAATPVGGTITLNTNINTGVNKVIGTELYIKYNPSILEATNIVPGGFFLNPEESYKTIDNNQGLITYALHLPTSAFPKTGTGVLAKVTFKAKAVGSSTVGFSTKTKIAATDVGATNALKSSTPTTITVMQQCNLPGDINDDGVVDILDYAILFENFLVNPPTDPRADLNNDGEVNILDYVVLYTNFGRRCI